MFLGACRRMWFGGRVYGSLQGVGQRGPRGNSKKGFPHLVSHP